MKPRRVVITGVGAVSGMGVGSAALWEGLLAGRCAIGVPTRVNLAGFACQLGAEVKDFSGKDHVPKNYRKAVKVMARDTEIAVAAAADAVAQARLVTRASEGGGATSYSPDRLGCQIGAGLIAAETEELTSALVTSTDEQGVFRLDRWGTHPAIGESGAGVGTSVAGAGGMNNLQPLWMLKYLPNMLACHVTIIHGNEGPSNTITCGEASGLLSIGEGTRVIERDAADATIAGSAESKLNLMGVLRMTLAGRFGPAPASSDPARAVRPYSPGAAGGVPGEGGGLLILEELQCALRRGVTPLAEVTGFGAAQSIPPAGTSTTSSATSGTARGLELALRAALRDAGITPAQVDAIVPQATGEAAWDTREAGALRAVFGDRLSQIELVTLSPLLGDCVAGTGGLQAAVGALMLRDQRLPARRGEAVRGLRCDDAPSRDARLRHVVVCSQSLGGQNAVLVLSLAPRQ